MRIAIACAVWLMAAPALAQETAAEVDGLALYARWQATAQVACGMRQPACEGSEALLEGAMAAFRESGNWAKRISMGKLLVNPQYGLQDTAAGRRALLDLGRAYEVLALPEMAADWLARYALAVPKAEDAPTALFDAARIKLMLDAPDALDLVNAHSKYYGRARRVEDARLRIELAERLLDRDAADDALDELRRVERRFRTPPPALAIHLDGNIARALEATGTSDDSYEAHMRTVTHPVPADLDVRVRRVLDNSWLYFAVRAARRADFIQLGDGTFEHWFTRRMQAAAAAEAAYDKAMVTRAGAATEGIARVWRNAYAEASRYAVRHLSQRAALRPFLDQLRDQVTRRDNLGELMPTLRHSGWAPAQPLPDPRDETLR